MKLIDRLPVIGLAVAGHFLCAKKVGNGNKATLIAILVDAQTLLCLRNRRACYTHLLAVGVHVVVGLAYLQSHRVTGRLLQCRYLFGDGMLSRKSGLFRATLKEVDLQLDPPKPVVAATTGQQRRIVHLPPSKGIQARTER